MAGCPLYTRATVVCAGRILSVAGTGRHGNAFLRWRSASPRWWRSVTRTSAFLSLLPSISVHFIFQGTEQHLLYLCRKVTYLFKKQRAAIGFLPKTLLSTFYLYPWASQVVYPSVLCFHVLGFRRLAHFIHVRLCRSCQLLQCVLPITESKQGDRLMQLTYFCPKLWFCTIKQLPLLVLVSLHIPLYFFIIIDWN